MKILTRTLVAGVASLFLMGQALAHAKTDIPPSVTVAPTASLKANQVGPLAATYLEEHPEAFRRIVQQFERFALQHQKTDQGARAKMALAGLTP